MCMCVKMTKSKRKNKEDTRRMIKFFGKEKSKSLVTRTRKNKKIRCKVKKSNLAMALFMCKNLLAKE